MANPEQDKVLVGTHDGKEFHADEVMAIAAIQLALLDRSFGVVTPKIDIIRTRDPAELADCDMLVDVGGEHDPDDNKFDHHQRGGAGERENGLPYAAFGLVWAKYGPKVCYGSVDYARYIDEHFVQLIDAYDNGIELFHTSTEGVHSISPGRPISNCNRLIGRDDDDKFKEALAGAQFLLEGEIGTARVACDTSPEIKEALNRSTRPDVVVLPNLEGTVWRDVLPDFSRDALCVVQPEDGRWVVRSTPEKSGGTGRKLFSEPLRGVEDSEKIREITGVSNVIFIHDGGFFAAAGTKEAAVDLANGAVNEYKTEDRRAQAAA